MNYRLVAQPIRDAFRKAEVFGVASDAAGRHGNVTLHYNEEAGWSCFSAVPLDAFEPLQLTYDLTCECGQIHRLDLGTLRCMIACAALEKRNETQAYCPIQP